MIRKAYLFLSLTILLGMFAHGQVAPKLNWALKMGSKRTDFGHALCRDKQGNVYATGSYMSVAQFDPKTTIGTRLENEAENTNNAFVVKYDPMGKLIWKIPIGADGLDSGKDIVCDHDGNVLVTGYFQEVVDFDPGYDVIDVEAKAGRDAFLLKLDGDGKFQWMASASSEREDFPQTICVDLNNNVYWTGGFNSTVTIKGATGSSSLTPKRKQDAYFTKISSGGDLKWAKRIGGSGMDQINGLVVSSANQLVITGSFQDSVNFGTPSRPQWKKSRGGKDILLAYCSLGGDILHVHTLGSSKNDYGVGISADQWGNVSITGNFNGTVDFDPSAGRSTVVSRGKDDAFIASYDKEGVFLWARGIGGTNNDIGRDVKIDAEGNRYLTGSFKGTIDLDPSALQYRVKSEGSLDAFVVKYDNTGDFKWGMKIGGPDIDYGSKIVLGDSGSVVVLGNFEGGIDYTPGKKFKIDVVSYGSSDILLASYGQVPDTTQDSTQMAGLESLRAGQNVVLKNVLFHWGESTLMTKAYSELNGLVSLMVENPTLRIRLEGHTDNVGSEAKNVRLSNARVMTVRSYLVEKGIASERIEMIGLGGSSPLFASGSSDLKERNRRVELRVLSWE